MQNVIELKDIRKSYGAKQALLGVTLSIRKGEIFGIVGPNGAGKTTLIEIIEGLRTADSGSATVLGKDIKKEASEIKKEIGVLLQSTSIPQKAKVKEVLSLFAAFYGKKQEDVAKVSKLFHLDERMNASVKSLSGGWKQRVSLALALIHDPVIVFLDEPSMGLDPTARLDMWNQIHQMRDEGRTIVVTTHYMEEAEHLCDRIAVINDGKLIALDTPKQLVQAIGNESERMITFQAVDGIDVAALSSIEGVTNSMLDKSMIKLHTTNMDRSLTELYRLANADGWNISGLKLEDASMNDVFNQLTKKKEEAVS